MKVGFSPNEKDHICDTIQYLSPFLACFVVLGEEPERSWDPWRQGYLKLFCQFSVMGKKYSWLPSKPPLCTMKLLLVTAWPVNQQSCWHPQNSGFTILTPVCCIRRLSILILSTFGWTRTPRTMRWPTAVVKTCDPK